MEHSDKGRTKWGDHSQDSRCREDSKIYRRGKPQVALYRPGSGPLRKSEEFVSSDNMSRFKSSQESLCSRGMPEEMDHSNVKGSSLESESEQQRPSTKSSNRANHESRGKSRPNPKPRDINKVTDSLENVHLASSGNSKYRRNSLGNTAAPTSRSSVNDKRRNKKPEQAIYVPKHGMQGITDKEVPKDSNLNKHHEENWDEDTKAQDHHSVNKNESRSMKSQNWDRNGSGGGTISSNRLEPFNKPKFESNRKMGRGSSDRDWQTSNSSAGVHKYMDNSNTRVVDGNTNKYQHDNKPTNFSGDRRNFHPMNDTNPRSDSLHHPSSVGGRELRQASEPRALPPTSLNMDPNRMRDTRSVEPAVGSWQTDKMQSKPPSGRRGSGKDSIPNSTKPSIKPHPCFDSLPPRLRKKYLQDNGLTDHPSYIGTTSEDAWDGSTVTFQGTSGGRAGYPMQHQQHPMSYQQHHPSSHQQHTAHQQRHYQQFHPHPQPLLQQPSHSSQYHPHQFHQPPPQRQWSNTMPGRARGRGRLQPNDLDWERTNSDISRSSRSLTPDRQSMPPPSLPYAANNPPRYSERRAPSHENVSLGNSVPSRSLHRSDSTRSYHQEEKRGTSQHLEENKPVLGTKQEDSLYRQRSDSNPSESRESSFSSGKQIENKIPSKNSTPNNTQQVSSSTSSENMKRNSVSPPILDWSEEVEANERLEAEGKLNADIEKTQPSAPRDKKRRRRKRSDRSASRGRESAHSIDRGHRGQSRDRHNRNHSRDRHKRGSHQEDSRYRGHSQDRNQRGSSQDFGSQDKDRNKDSHRRTETKERNWREESKEKEAEKALSSNQIAGILVLPHQAPETSTSQFHSSSEYHELSRTYPPPPYRDTNQQQTSSRHQQRHLFNPNNPTKPIMVSASGPRAAVPPPPSTSSTTPVPITAASPTRPVFIPPSQLSYNNIYQGMTSQSDPSYVSDQLGNSRPSWYDPYSPNASMVRFPQLLGDIEQADKELQWYLSTGALFKNWNRVMYIRQFLQQSFQVLLVTDIKFCQMENVEQHLWKVLFYNIIEVLRKGVAEDAENKDQLKQTMLKIIDEGSSYLDSLLEVLEQTYKFKLETFLSPNHVPTKGLGFAGLALVSAQKIFLFLGDLARYKEQVNETTNFGKSRQCYIKAHQINPKNGRPYNQLAILAFYARRKLDAVYYYMRSLMASNPFQSAKESLLSLFEESRKKFEQSERKRRDERESKHQDRMKEKEGAGKEAGGNGLRREYWIHPEGGRRRLHITTTAQDQRRVDSEEEELYNLSSIDVNKRFVTSYLHVHGKLFTKVGMETFQDAALQMLREFRALLQHSPVPLNANRFLQLLALNMFAIENTQLKDSQLEPGYRSAVQESALVVSIQMFNLILERCVSLLREQLSSPAGAASSRLVVSEDMLVLLPAVKVWCDWLLCHGGIWNPPPSCQDYRVGPAGDAWSRLATLVNLLEKLDHHGTELVPGPPSDNYDLVRLPEDATLCGFTPLMYNSQEPLYTTKDTDMELAQITLRIRKIIFFGTVFLCGVDPPVLKLQKFDGVSEFVSVVQTSSQDSPSSIHQGFLDDDEDKLESYSEDEGEDEATDGTSSPVTECSGVDNTSDIQNLLVRKEELERKHHIQEKHRQKVQAILRESVASVEIEVKPHHLVPDTNCFIDYLQQLEKITEVGVPHPTYMLMVPLIVVKELEGLARGGRDRVDPPTDPDHTARVAESAKGALVFLRSRHPAVRCVTSKGTVLTTSAFTVEEDGDAEKNDDRILTTALHLSRTSGKDLHKPGEPRRLHREVVLLTEDRNLRVKALARDLPVREVPHFIKWAGLG